MKKRKIFVTILELFIGKIILIVVHQTKIVI